MPQALRDPVLAERLDGDGYVITPLFDAATVADLLAAHEQLAPTDDDGLTVDYMRPDRTVMRRVRDLLAPHWAQCLPAVFVDHRPVMTTFVVKHPGDESGMFLHEDRSYVQDPDQRTYTVWVPLVDTGPEVDNGGLELVPGSQRLAVTLGGSSTPELFRPYEEDLRAGLVPVTVPAGHAVVYDTRTLHASPPNRSDRSRVAIVCAVAPVGAELVHVVATTAHHRRVHAVTPDFFVEHHPREIEVAMPGDCPVVAEYDEAAVLSPGAVQAVLGGPVPVPRPVITDELRGDEPPPWLPYRDDAGRSQPVARRGRRGPRVEVHADAPEVTTLDLPEGRQVTVHPGGRARLALPGGPGWCLEVTHTPTLTSGVLTADGAANFEIGREVDLGEAAEATVWNDGPGEVTLVVRPRRGRRADR